MCYDEGTGTVKNNRDKYKIYESNAALQLVLQLAPLVCLRHALKLKMCRCRNKGKKY